MKHPEDQDSHEAQEGTITQVGIEESVTDGEPLEVAEEPAAEPTAEVLSADPAAALKDPRELSAAIEAVLFASPDPIPVKKLAKALGDIDLPTLNAAIDELRADYNDRGRGIRLVEVAGGFQIATRERFAEFIMALGTRKTPPSLSNATLETLAIIAYRQPITRAAVEAIRGVESSGTIRNLLDMELIELTGRQEVVGRPPLYGTTEKFLRAFGLRRIKDLPSIRGLRDRFLKTEKPNATPVAESETPAQDSGEPPEPAALAGEETQP